MEFHTCEHCKMPDFKEEPLRAEDIYMMEEIFDDTVEIDDSFIREEEEYFEELIKREPKE